MNQNNKDDKGCPRKGLTLHRLAADHSENNQQENNASGVNNYNPYADWTFDQLYSECKRRKLL